MEELTGGIDIDDEVFCANVGTSREDPANTAVVEVMKLIFDEPLRRRE